MPAHIIVSGGQKGGTGKTMLATHLATMFADQPRGELIATRHLELGGTLRVFSGNRHERMRVLLIDADSQRSSASWVEERGDGVVACKELSGNLFYSLLALERDYDVIIVDAGGADSDEFRTAVAKAHAVYPTVMPSKVDLKTMGLVNDIVGQARAAGNDTLVARVLINKAPASPVSAWRTETAREYLSLLANLTVAETHVCFRAAFQDAYDANKAVFELGPSKATDEMNAFFQEVLRDAGRS